MSVEELLKPRYKVIAEWPESTFEIGQIITKSDLVEDWLQTDNFLHGFKLSAVEKYPHLFKKLEWWEERKLEDMPKYVRWDYKPGCDGAHMKNLIAKVDGWVQASYGVISQGQTTSSHFWLPATEQEYNDYLTHA